MDHGKALFIILTAMVIASSILSVGSLTLINALSTDLFAKAPGAQGEPIFKLRGDDVHLTRERVLYYPRKMFMFYMLCFVMALVYVGTYLGPLQMKEDHGVLVRFISFKNAQLLHDFAREYLFPAFVLFYLGYCLYIVVQTKTVCGNLFIFRRDAV